MARDLTKSCFDILRPGGRLRVASLSDKMQEAGYMENFMGWRPSFPSPGG